MLNANELPTGLIAVDSDLNVLAADRLFLETIGVSVDDPLGRSLPELLGPASGLDPLELIPDAAGGSGCVYTTRKTATGERRRLRVCYARARLDDADQPAIFITVQDLSPSQSRNV